MKDQGVEPRPLSRPVPDRAAVHRAARVLSLRLARDRPARPLHGRRRSSTGFPRLTSAITSPTDVTVQLRHEIDKVALDGVTFYRRDWQGVIRREPRVVRSEGDRIVCSLWALGRSIEDRLVLDRAGEVLEARFRRSRSRPAVAAASRLEPGAGGADRPRERAGPGRLVGDVMAGLTLEWGGIAATCSAWRAATIGISRRLRDAAVTWIRDASRRRRARGARGGQFVLEVARLLAPTVRLRAQMRLEEVERGRPATRAPSG